MSNGDDDHAYPGLSHSFLRVLSSAPAAEPGPKPHDDVLISVLVALCLLFISMVAVFYWLTGGRFFIIFYGGASRGSHSHVQLAHSNDVLMQNIKSSVKLKKPESPSSQPDKPKSLLFDSTAPVAADAINDVKEAMENASKQNSFLNIQDAPLPVDNVEDV